jgi:Flp pilus assembly protein TadG
MHSLFNCKGQSIVEISLITPLLLVALYVPFDFGMTLFTGHLTQNAVRDGARIASQSDLFSNAIATSLATDVFNRLPNLLVTGSPSTKTVTVTFYGGANCAQNVAVNARGTYNFFLYRLIGMLGFPAPGPIQITRTTRMRYEFQPDSNGTAGTATTFCSTATFSGTHT